MRQLRNLGRSGKRNNGIRSGKRNGNRNGYVGVTGVYKVLLNLLVSTPMVKYFVTQREVHIPNEEIKTHR